MELKKLIKNTSYLTVVSFVQFLTGMVRSKINAVIIGVAGVGIINQLSFLTNKMFQLSTLSMNSAVVKQIAENKSKKEVSELISSSLKSYIVLTLSFLSISLIFLILFSKEINLYFLGNSKYLVYFYVGLFSFPILILNSIPFSVIQAFKDIKLIAFARSGAIIVNLIIFIPLVIILKLKGAVLFIPLSYIVTLMFNYFLAQKYYFKKLNLNFKRIVQAKINNSFVKELLLFSGFGLLLGTYGIISESVIRSIIVSELGIKSIGVYSPVLAAANLLMTFVLPSFTTYLYPRFAEAKTNMEISGILNDAIRLSSFVFLPIAFIIIPYRIFFIRLFYSIKFLDAGIYLPYHFFGLLFYVWFFALMISMSPTGKIKQHSLFQFFYFSFDILVVYFMVPRLGLYGWTLKYIISPFIFFNVYYLFNRIKIGFRFSKSNIILMTYTFFSTLILVFMAWKNYSKTGFIAGPLLITISWFLLEKNEKNFLYSKILFIKRKIIK